MIFLWHGFGWAGLLLLGCLYGLFQSLLPGRSETFITGLAFISAAVPLWFLGRWLRDNYVATITDRKTRTYTQTRQRYHAVFWIPLHWWAVILLPCGVLILITEPGAETASPKPALSDRQTEANAAGTKADGAADNSTWITFTSPAGDFSISAPNRLVDKSQNLQGRSGTIQRHCYSTSVSNVYFAVERNDFPDGAISTQPVDEVINRSRDRAVSALGGRLLGDASLSIGNHVWREVEIETSDQARITTSRLHVTGDHLYSIIVVARAADRNNPSIRRFLDSFRFLREMQ